MAYKHLDTLTGTTTQDTSVALPAGIWVAVQAKGTVVRVASGVTTATASTSQGLRVFPDQPPVEFRLGPNEDRIASISEDGTTLHTLEILNAGGNS